MDNEYMKTVNFAFDSQECKTPAKNEAINDEQMKLYKLITEFTVETIIGFISNAYKTINHEMFKNGLISVLLSQFAGSYFNQCAHWVFNRKDEYINKKFDEMIAVKLPLDNGYKAYEAIDILHVCVMLGMQILVDMKLSHYISDNYDETMQSIKRHLESIADNYKHTAIKLKGCPSDIIHKAPEPDEYIFDVSLRKACMDSNGTVTIKDNWFDNL